MQGLLGGLAFWVLGIDAAIFWGIVMTVLSLLPAIGAALIWIPAAIILLATGSYVKGLIALVLLGTFVISLVDNFLRPILVSRDTEMPDYLVLIATLGGLTAFGISGFVIGPVIASLFLTVWLMFEDEHGGADNVAAVKNATHAERRPPAGRARRRGFRLGADDSGAGRRNGRPSNPGWCRGAPGLPRAQDVAGREGSKSRQAQA